MSPSADLDTPEEIKEGVFRQSQLHHREEVVGSHLQRGRNNLPIRVMRERRTEHAVQGKRAGNERTGG